MSEFQSVEQHPWLVALGGRRGLIDGAVPPVVFVAANAVTGLTGAATHALHVAVAAATVTALAIVAHRARRGESLKGGLRGLAGLAVAVAFAAWTGQARDFFLPGIYVDATYGAAFAASAMAGRPVVGYVYASMFRIGSRWRTEPRLRRALTVATYGWSLVFCVRTAVQAVLYRADQPELLALAKVLLGWPLTVAAVMLTLAAARRARPGHCRSPGPAAP
jgi:Mn2+/Fe2+ NRAMP family transporter